MNDPRDRHFMLPSPTVADTESDRLRADLELERGLHAVTLDALAAARLEYDGAKSVLDFLQGECEQTTDALIKARAELTELKESLPGYILDRLGVEEDDACPKCDGVGRRCYASTSTWMGGAGGQVLTVGTCDTCWGSGSASRPWPSLRAATMARKALEQERDEARRMLLSISALTGAREPSWQTAMGDYEQEIVHQDTQSAEATATIARLESERDEARVRERQRCIAIARGCVDYQGGYSDEMLAAYHHGIGTVVNVLSAPHGDRQSAVVEALGRTLADRLEAGRRDPAEGEAP